MIRAVIFDFNGILADDDPIHMRAFRQVAQEEGLTFSEQEYLEKYLPLNDRDCFRELWAASGVHLSDDLLASLIARKSVYYFEATAGQSVLFSGAAEAIRAAANRGPVGIASGASILEIRHILGTADLLASFSTIVAAEDVVNGKPHPEPFMRACEQLKPFSEGLTPAECLAVEDSLGGIESARAAGMPCLGVAHSYAPDRLRGKAQWVIDSISDFKNWLDKV